MTLLTAATAVAVPAFAAVPTVSGLSPTTGTVGRAVTITGSGFGAGTQVRFAGVASKSVRVVSSTSVVATVPVTGSGRITVQNADRAVTSTGTFTVTPGATVSAAVVRPTGSVTVSAVGFAGGEAVDVVLDAAPLPVQVSAANGTVVVAVAVPRATTPGPHRITLVGRRSGSAAQTTVTVRTDWARPGFDEGNTGYDRFENVLTRDNAADVTRRWGASLGFPSYHAPVVAGGRVFVHGIFGVVTARSATTGAALWSVDLSTDTNATDFSPPIVAGGLLYVGTDKGTMYALDVATGATRWSVTFGGGIRYGAALSGGRLFVPSMNNGITALDAATGAVLWARQAGGAGAVPYSVTAVGGRVYYGASDDQLRQLSADGGGGWAVAVGGDPYAAPVVVNGVVYVGTLNGNAYAVREATGAQLWTADTGAGSVTGSPTLAGGRLVIGNTNSVTTAYDPATGVPLWSRSGSGQGAFTRAVSIPGVALVSAGTYSVLYDLRDGTVLGTLSLGTAEGGVVVSDGAIYGTDFDTNTLERWDLGGDTV